MNRAAWLVLPCVLFAARATAQTPPPTPPGSTGRLFGVDDEPAPGMPASRPRVIMRLEYTRAPGAEACPDEQALRDLVGARVRGWAPFAPNGPWRLTVVVGPRAGGYSAAAELRDVTGAVQWTRVLDPRQSCVRVLTDLAVVLTLHVEPPSPPPRPGPPGEVPAVPPVPAPLSKEEPVAPAAPARSPVALLFGARGWMDLSTAPRPAFGVTADVGFRVGWFSLRGEVRWDPPAGATVMPGVEVSTARLLGALVPCGQTSGDVSFVGCLVGELGQIQGSLTTMGTPRPTESRRFAALGPRVGLDFLVTRHLFVQVAAEVLGADPLRFLVTGTKLPAGTLPGGAVWETGSIVGGIGVGLGASF